MNTILVCTTNLIRYHAGYVIHMKGFIEGVMEKYEKTGSNCLYSKWFNIPFKNRNRIDVEAIINWTNYLVEDLVFLLVKLVNKE